MAVEGDRLLLVSPASADPLLHGSLVAFDLHSSVQGAIIFHPCCVGAIAPVHLSTMDTNHSSHSPSRGARPDSAGTSSRRSVEMPRSPVSCTAVMCCG